MKRQILIADLKKAKEALDLCGLKDFLRPLVFYQNAIWELSSNGWLLKERLPIVKVTTRKRKKK